MPSKWADGWQRWKAGIELQVHIARIRLFQQPPYAEEISDHLSNNPIVLDALPYIGEQIYENIKAQDITERFYISRFYLSKIFQEKLGISIHQFILKKKLFLARQDLLNESSINETYQKYGFGDYSSFYRAFKSEFDLSPRNWKSR